MSIRFWSANLQQKKEAAIILYYETASTKIFVYYLRIADKIYPRISFE